MNKNDLAKFSRKPIGTQDPGDYTYDEQLIHEGPLFPVSGPTYLAPPKNTPARQNISTH